MNDDPVVRIADDPMPTVAARASIPPTASVFVDRSKSVRDAFTARWVADSLARVVARQGSAVLGLVGGSSVGGVHDALADPAIASEAGLDWTDVSITVADERAVPDGSDDRNWRVVEHLVDPLVDAGRLPDDNLHPLDDVPADPTPDDVEDALGSLRTRVERLDVVLLGLGPDGHVASLFPHHPALGEGGSFVVVDQAPKPPPLRMSATVAMLAGCDAIALVGAGETKADAVAAVLAEGPLADCPARLVHLPRRSIIVTDHLPT